MLISPANPAATGKIILYAGRDKMGTYMLTSDTGVVNQFVSRNNSVIKDGVNEFFAEFIPDTVDWSYATATNSYVKTAFATKISVSPMNYGDYVKLVCRAYDSYDNLLDPHMINTYLGATNDGILLNGSTISTGSGTIDCTSYNMTNMTVTFTVPKSELFVGLNEFYSELVDPQGVYGYSSRYTTFEMDADGNPVVRNEGFTREDIENLLTILGQITDGQEINFTNLILALNKLTDTLDGDLKTIADYLQDLQAGGGNGGSISNAEIVEALENISNKMGSVWFKFKNEDGDEYWAPENGGNEGDEIVVDVTTGDPITKVVNESEMLEYLADIVNDVGITLNDTISDFLEKINNTIEDGFEEQNKLLEDIKNILGDEFGEYFDSLTEAIESSSTEIDLGDLSSLVSGGITEAQFQELINAIREGNGDSKMDELINALGNINIDTDGIEDKLDDLIGAIENNNQQDYVMDTSDLENILGEINNSIQNSNTGGGGGGTPNVIVDNNNEELSKLIEEMLKELAEDDNNNSNTTGVSAEFLEDLLKSIEASVSRGGTDNTELLGVLDRIATNLEKMGTGSTIDTSGLEALLKEYYKPIDYNEIINAIDRAVTNANRGNNADITNAIAGLTDAVNNGSLDDEELAAIFGKLDSLEKRLAEGIEIKGLDRLDALVDILSNTEVKLSPEVMDILNRLVDKADQNLWEQIPMAVRVLAIMFLVVGSAGFVTVSVAGVYIIKKVKLDVSEIDDQTS